MTIQTDYSFTLGESKEVGVLVSSSDGSNFSISGSFSHKDQYGTIFSTGDVTIDGYKIYTLITPSLPSSGQFVEFILNIIPLDQNGVPDPNKNMEKIIPIVYIDVYPEK